MDVDLTLAATLAPLLRDLEAGRVPSPRVEASDWNPGNPGAMLYGEDGRGWGISLRADAPPAEQLAHLADQVQEWAVEDLWSAGRSAVWPSCPDHPDSHPLQPQVADEFTPDAAAVWRCPKSGHAIAAIGELPATSEGRPRAGR